MKSKLLTCILLFVYISLLLTACVGEKTVAEWREEYPRTDNEPHTYSKMDSHVGTKIAWADAICVLTPIEEYTEGPAYFNYVEGSPEQQVDPSGASGYSVDYRFVKCRVDQVLYGDLEEGDEIQLTGVVGLSGFIRVMKVGEPFVSCMIARTDMGENVWGSSDGKSFYLTKDKQIVPCGQTRINENIFGMKLEEFSELVDFYAPLDVEQINREDGSIIDTTEIDTSVSE